MRKLLVNALSFITRISKFALGSSAVVIPEMTAPTFHSYPGIGQKNSNNYHYSQSVRYGSVIKCAGQGGFDENGNALRPMREQLRMAFKNVERALHDAGGKGWSQVISVHSYHIDLDDSFQAMVDLLKEFMPHRRPVWVAIGVAKLGEGMFVEIEVEAFDE